MFQNARQRAVAYRLTDIDRRLEDFERRLTAGGL